MHDIRAIRENPTQFDAALARRGLPGLSSDILALDEAVHAGRVERGDLILMIAFGGGFTWGATVVEW